MSREVYWHLPGFCYFFYLNQVIINLMKEHPKCFVEGYRVGSVYGTFPGAIWNGGRAVFGVTAKQDMEKIIATYNTYFYGSVAEPMSCIIGTFHAMYHTKAGSYVHEMGIKEGGKMALLASVGPMGLAAIDYAIHPL